MTEAPRHYSFSMRLDCHYLLRAAAAPDAQTCLIVALHGFSQTAEAMLPLAEKMFGPRHAIASMQGPNQFFLDSKVSEVGYCWVTNRYPAQSIRLHHDMVRHVLEEAGAEFQIPPERRFLLGFSQPVSLNYRFAATWPDCVRGVVGVCGGLPGDWEKGDYQPVSASVLHIARRQDSFYPASVTEQYPARLRLRVEDVEFHLLDGGHQFPSQGGAIAEGWLKRVLR